MASTLSRIVGYARVSSLDQDFQIQIDQLTAAGAESIYAEKKSGTQYKNRPELEAAIKALRPGDTLLVTRLDRFARNLSDLVTLVNRIREAGAELRAVHQAFSTEGPTGRLMLNILGTIAEFETDLRRERQLEGIAKAKSEGRYDPARHAISPNKLSWASRFLRQGMSYVQVAEKTGISIDTLQRRWPQYKAPVAVAREAAKRVVVVPVSMNPTPAVVAEAFRRNSEPIRITQPKRKLLGLFKR